MNTVTTPLRRTSLALVVATLTACAGSQPEPEHNVDFVRVAPPALSTPAEEQAADELRNSDTGLQEIMVTGSRPASPKAERADLAQPSGFSNSAAMACCPRAPVEPIDRENYQHFDDNTVKIAAVDPVSTFSIDVDTGSYSNMRRFLSGGQLPPADAVRVEELINYFSYDYPVPRNSDTPFTVITEVAETPWNPNTLLLHVGLKGFEVERTERPASNLVFLVDVSGSMRSPDKLPLLKDALIMLTRHLDERDTISIAGYAGGAGLILPPTSGANTRTIVDALESLNAAGRTNGAQGIHLAYQLAEEAFIDDGINRVIIATDGDFNVGTVSFDALISLIEEKRRSGVALTALGFGTGNYNDKLLEQLADAGDGNYAYIDTRREARKVLVEEMASTLQTIASDVKIQIEFNAAVVAEYRLIGYENRMLRREDFNNDAIDAGEIGAGHTVTALYEVTLQGSPAILNEPLRYAEAATLATGSTQELAFVRLRYKQPDADTSRLIERVVRSAERRQMSRDFRFASAVAAFGQRLRGGDYLNGYDFEDILALAERGIGRDEHGYRSEFVELVAGARALSASAGRDERDYHVVN